MVLFAALIAGSFSLGRMALPYIEPVPLNAIRFIFAALIMGVIAFGLRREPVAVPQAPWRFLITGGLMAFYFVSMFIALTMTSPVATSAVFTLTPILTAFFGYFIVKQRLTGLMAISLLFAGLGSIWVIFRGDVNAILGFDIGQGELIYFAGCAAHAVYTPLLRRFNRGEPLVVLTLFNVAATAVWITIAALPDLMQIDFAALPPVVWLVLLYLAIFPTATTFFLVQFASVTLPASKVMAYGYLVPVFVIVYEGLLGNGWVSVSVLAGALVTVLGLAVLYFAHDKRSG
ncbi:MAG: DMT family transporter [Hyphomicrobiaceae bacterium]|nr:DMT family transporter [Hyphomicrobiaceae bacterium]MCC0023874.1 DMT family transporter [Hyphomicrobiaceae bacterium]